MTLFAIDPTADDGGEGFDTGKPAQEIAVRFIDSGISIPPEGSGDAHADPPIGTETIDEVEVVVAGEEIE